MSAESIPFVVDEQELEHQERALAASGEDRLPALVSLAWHLRQRDGKRAATLAREARQSMAQGELALGESNVRTLDLRLTLVDAEIHWGQADFEQAQRLVDEAMTQARASGDLAAAADAHWIDASLAGDLGDTARRDEGLQACEALARRVGEQTRGERLQSELFFEALRRTL